MDTLDLRLLHWILYVHFLTNKLKNWTKWCRYFGSPNTSWFFNTLIITNCTIKSSFFWNSSLSYPLKEKCLQKNKNKNTQFLDSIMLFSCTSWMPDLCTRNWYALMLLSYPLNMQSIALCPILTCIGFGTSTLVKYPTLLNICAKVYVAMAIELVSSGYSRLEPSPIPRIWLEPGPTPSTYSCLNR